MKANNTPSDITTASDPDEILVAFAQAGALANTGAWMQKYPRQAGEIARYAADRWVGDSDIAGGTTGAARLRTIGRETVRTCRAAAALTTTPALADLVMAAKARGLDKRTFAQRLQVPYALLFKLQRRLIVPASIPAALVQRIAQTLERTAGDVTAYLQQPPTLAPRASYRADDTPEVGAQVLFADALHSDPEITDAQRSQWLSPNPD